MKHNIKASEIFEGENSSLKKTFESLKQGHNIKEIENRVKDWLNQGKARQYPEVVEFIVNEQIDMLDDLVEFCEERKRYMPIQTLDGNPMSWKKGHDKALQDTITRLQKRKEELKELIK